MGLWKVKKQGRNGKEQKQEDYPTTKIVLNEDWKTTLHLLPDYAIDVEQSSSPSLHSITIFLQYGSFVVFSSMPWLCTFYRPILTCV